MSPIAQLISNNLLDENVFSLFLSRGETDNAGQLVLGGLVEEQFYEGEFTTIPTTTLPAPHLDVLPDIWVKGDKWKVEAQSLSIGEGPLIKFNFKNPTVAVFQTFFPWIIVPVDVANTINNFLDAETWGMLAWVDCKKRSEMPDITIVLAGQEFVLTAYDYLIEQVYSEEPGLLYCMSAFGMGFEEDEGLIFLGTSFLKAWVSVWNLDELTIGCEYFTLEVCWILLTDG
jgi:saccharopepsin